MNINAERLLHTEDAANLLALTSSTLNTYRSMGKGPKYVKLEGRTIRYPLSYLLEYAYQNTVDSTSVQNKGSLSLLLDRSSIRNEIQTILNKHAIQGLIDHSSIIKDFMSKDNINNLPWAFDKLVLNFEVSEEQVNHLILKLGEKEKKGLVVSEGGNRRYHNMCRAKLKRGEDTAITVLFDDPDKVIKQKVQVQLNPSHFKKNGKILCKVFKCLFGEAYLDILLNAWVSRIDICFDLEGVSTDAVIYRFKGTRKRHTVKTIKAGGTVYNAEGSRRRNRCKKYQKRDCDKTRIEFEFYPKHKTLQLKDILDYQMPFKRFEIYSPEFFLCGCVHPHTIHAIDALGITGAITSINCKAERKKLKKAIKEHLLVQDYEQFQAIATVKISQFLNLLADGAYG